MTFKERGNVSTVVTAAGGRRLLGSGVRGFLDAVRALYLDLSGSHTIHSHVSLGKSKLYTEDSSTS